MKLGEPQNGHLSTSHTLEYSVLCVRYFLLVVSGFQCYVFLYVLLVVSGFLL